MSQQNIFMKLSIIHKKTAGL